MVKCIMDGELVLLGGPNLLEVDYYTKLKNPRELVITEADMEDVGKNSKVVEELIYQKSSEARLKIVYIHCFDWSAKSEETIKIWMDKFVETEEKVKRGKTERYIIDVPIIISVVQDKDYWPGSELEDPLVLERRLAKEKEFIDNWYLRYKPDHKIVKRYDLSGDFYTHPSNLLKEDCPRPPLTWWCNRKRSCFRCGGRLYSNIPSFAPGESSSGAPVPPSLLPRWSKKRRSCYPVVNIEPPRAQPSFLKRSLSDSAGESSSDAPPQKRSKNDTYLEKLKKEETSPAILKEDEDVQLLSPLPSFPRRYRPWTSEMLLQQANCQCRKGRPQKYIYA